MKKTNPLGIHWLVLSKTWDAEGARHAIREARRIGYDFIETPPTPPEADITRITRDALAEAGLAATVCLGLSADQDLTSPDPEIRARGEAFLMEAVDTCARIGGFMVSGITYSAFQKYLAPCTAEGRATSVEAIRRVAERAQPHGIEIGLEVVNRYETNLLNTAEQALAFCRDTGMENVKIHLDSYHMNIEETDIGRAIRNAGDRIGFFHIGDSNRGYLGAGNIDFNPYFRALCEAGYAGPVSFESFSSTMIDQPLLGILAIWRDTWEDGQDLAEHSFEVMRALVKSGDEAHRRALG
ncbi:epimerase [Gemmobacter nanjingensis]|jgi:D-psicose/D-tagatose/L-ribulose 3-epimerase|uniref:Epimerase n=1 Tax=Gemmobacter nanjingensis TaxID=488454 RepID=A0ABQ3FIA8_9RHOB|nr:sugar phosphate isomerase/epimerase family protein [Gemmobacter nanjingensis]GHC24926.1 epimerase [Gemmobacter nanjingensis]